MRNIAYARSCVVRQLARPEIIDPEQRACLKGMLVVLNRANKSRGSAVDLEQAFAVIASRLARRGITKEQRALLNGEFTALNWIEGRDGSESRALQNLIDGRHVILRLTGTPLPPGKAPILFVSPWGEVAESVLTS